MAIQELLTSLRIGRAREQAQVKTEPKLPRVALNQFIVGFQMRANYTLDASPLSQTQVQAIRDEKTGQARFDIDHGYIKIINKAESDGNKVGIYIENVWIDGKDRSYRLLTTSPKNEIGGEVYFAEFYDDQGERKLRDRQVDTAKATVEADRVLALAIALSSKPRKLF